MGRKEFLKWAKTMNENNTCNHSFSKSMNEPRPRLCIHCKEPEICQACIGYGDIHMCGKEMYQKEKPKPIIDLEYFKNYVETYHHSTHGGSKSIFIKDMLYGIGLAIDGDEYKMANGFAKFIDYLQREIL